MTRETSLSDLPLDILTLIFPYLDIRSFLSLTATCQGFYSIRLDPLYWENATISAFRLPNRPTVGENDGLRWMKLYRRMLTQTRAYTWGSNNRQCLGRTPMGRVDEATNTVSRPRHVPTRFGHYGRAATGPVFHSDLTSPSVPKEMLDTRELGIIADLQCGGWSTTLLTSRGTLHSCGVLDGINLHLGILACPLTELTFPPHITTFEAAPGLEEYTKIRQFSSGRGHVLGLADSGRIWSWDNISKSGMQIRFAHTDIVESQSNSELKGYVRKVVAGWSRSSAYITGTGIVVWDADVVRTTRLQESEADTALIGDYDVIAKTRFLRPQRKARYTDAETNQLGEEVGEVVNWIVLEHFVVIVTDVKKVFVIDIRVAGSSVINEVIPLSQLSEEDATPSAVDIQGSFRSFGVFKSNGEIVTVTQGYLDAWCYQQPLPPLKAIPALQNNNVIQLSFGDYHFLALHGDGNITSYGTEPQACGSLGLGDIVEAPRDSSIPGKALRGLEAPRSSDWKLLPHCYARGRQVWFQQEKHNWLDILGASPPTPTIDPDNGNQNEEGTHVIMRDNDARGEASEWVEQQAKDWDKQEVLKHLDEDNLGAHFALCVAAAGWHSGALMLVNGSLEDAVAEWYRTGVHEGKEGKGKEKESSSADEVADTSHPSSGVSPGSIPLSLPPMRLNDSSERPRWIAADAWKETPSFDIDALRDLTVEYHP